MTTLAIQRTISGVLTSADSATVTVYDSTGLAITGPNPVTPSSEGVYSFTTIFLAPGTYTATWIFVVAGQPNDIISRAFSADGPAQVVTGTRLMDIERRVAKRLGPYREYRADGTSDESGVVIKRLKTSTGSGDYEDLFILRRGVYRNGSIVPDFPEDDRQRLVSTYDGITGTLAPDFPWELAPQTDEVIELHYLDPEQELRPIVVAGLERCYMWDRAILTTTSASRLFNLTASFPWMLSPGSVGNVEQGLTSDITPALNMMWYNPYMYNGALYIQTNMVGAGNLYITYLRPHSTLVNGEVSQTGPNDDFDVLTVDPEYAVRSAHVQAWIDLTDRLMTVSTQGLRITSEMASDAFTQKSRQIVQQIPDRVLLRWETDLSITQVGNAPGESS